MKIQQLPVDAALASLKSGPNGLAHAEAARRLREYGPNRVEEAPQEHLALRFGREFTHFFALILWLAAALAFVAEFSEPGQGMAALGWAILGVIAINGLFSFWQEYRAEKAIAALARLLPAQVLAVRGGENIPIPAADVVPGDILLLEEGDNVPADCRLIEAFGLRVNNATVTGESLPQARDAVPSGEENLLRAKNVVLAGTSVVSGEGRALVAATGMHTEFGKIAHLTQSAGDALSPLQREIIRVSRLVAVIATLLGAVFFLIGRLIGLSFWENFVFAIGIIVANVPEGLLPTVTLALAMATQRMAKGNALIRHLPAVETLGATTVICTDKTGTLTQNRMSVKRLFLDGRLCEPGEPTGDGHRLFLETAYRCHSLKRAAGVWLGDPMEAALAEMAASALPDLAPLTKVNEVPFDTDRKRMSLLCDSGDGLILYTKGAPETVLPLCAEVLVEGEVRPLDAALRAQFVAAQEAMAAQGLRILAFASRGVAQGYDKDGLEHALILTGLAGLEDPPRPEVPAAIGKCFAAGIKVIMVTGDHPHTALAIGREIGLIRSGSPAVISGEALARLSQTQLQLALDAPEIIFARVGADQKLRVVEALKRKGHIVAVTGDGVNDAPALKQAHIGIAMGIGGTDVAKEASDMILLDDNFASIVSAVEEGRAVFANIRKFLTYILTSNIPEIIPYLAFVLLKIPLPLTVMQILAVDLGTDMLPALGLGVEKADPDVMKKPPRPRAERLLNWPLLARAYLFLGMLEAAAAMAAFFYVLHGGGWQYGASLANDSALYLQATTATLSAIIVMQVVNAFLCRNPSASILSTGLSGNRLILAGIAAEIALILMIDYTTWGNDIFGTAPISMDAWLSVLPFALGMLVLEEGRKWLVRRATA